MEYRQQAEMEDCRLIAIAKKEAKKTVLKSYFEALLRNGLFEQFEDSPHTIQFIKASQEALANMNDPMLKEFKCIWITLTPEECHDYDNNPKRLAEEIIKWLEKSSHVSTYSFAIEQRSDNIELMGKGVHAHILIQQTDLTCTSAAAAPRPAAACRSVSYRLRSAITPHSRLGSHLTFNVCGQKTYKFVSWAEFAMSNVI